MAPEDLKATKIVPARMPQSRFIALLNEMAQTHADKSKDYGSDTDRLKNLRASARLGIAPAQGTAVRMGDKWARIEELIKRRYSSGEGPAVADETLLDTLKDTAVYALLLIELLEEEDMQAQDNRIGQRLLHEKIAAKTAMAIGK